jgi:hypothetical protein
MTAITERSHATDRQCETHGHQPDRRDQDQEHDDQGYAIGSENTATSMALVGSRRSTGRDQELLELICEARRGGDEVAGTGRYQPARPQR